MIHAFNERGCDALAPKWSGGAPRRIDEQARDWICVIARCDPRFLGQPFSCWSLTKLRDYLIAAALRGHELGYVLAVACSHRVPTGLGIQRADQIAADLPTRAWQQIFAGQGAKGHRYYDRAFVTLPLAADQHDGHHWLLIRRNRTTGELAFYRCWSPQPVPLHQLIAIAGRRWSIEGSFQATKTGLGLDQHQHRRWRAWHRWTTLVIAHTHSSPPQRQAPPTRTA